MDEADKMLDGFLKWAADLGVSDSPAKMSASQTQSSLGESLVVAQFPEAGGRGLGAARELKRGELILRVPRAALLYRESLLEDPRFALAVKKYPQLSSSQILAACLLAEVEKGKDSRWAPYLMQMPRIYQTLSTFTWFEIQALQVEDAIWASEKAFSKAQSEWKDAVLLMEEIGLRSELLSFRSWLWASATISSRTMHIPWDNAGCLCPVGDFFNYAAPEEECFCSEAEDEKSPRLIDACYEEDLAAYCFYARRNYKKGEQVLLCYGTYSNLELLEHYGFVLNTNPNCKAFIRLDPEIQFSCSWPADALYIQQDGRPSFALLSALRLWAIPPKCRKATSHLAYSGSMLSVGSEIFVMKWLAKRCLEILHTMPSTAEEDCMLLEVINQLKLGKIERCVAEKAEVLHFYQANGLQEGDKMTNKAKRSVERWELAIKWRLLYKKTLTNCISFCNNISNCLDCKG